MRVKIVGGTASQKKHITAMVKFCAKKLMPRIKNLDITVKMTNLTDAYGYCLSNEEIWTDRPRTFEIEVHRKMRLRRILEVVAHEMVHAKQYARGELYVGARNAKHRWQGKWMSENVNYWDHPWEIEAHGREAGLFIQYAEQNDLGKYAWTQDING
jgi:hypothetical protein